MSLGKNNSIKSRVICQEKKYILSWDALAILFIILAKKLVKHLVRLV